MVTLTATYGDDAIEGANVFFPISGGCVVIMYGNGIAFGF